MAGGVGAWSVYGEKTKLVWDKHDIVDHKMVGYRELVGPGRKGETTGQFHRYLADVESKNIGSYNTPRVLRYKGEETPESSAPPKKDRPERYSSRTRERSRRNRFLGERAAPKQSPG